MPTWKKAYQLRVVVFVEYESEVEEERGRVKALLEKLRIEAEVLVFWLASGGIATYETIVHGHFQNLETETLVDKCLKDQEWWDDLQVYRGSRSMTSSQEFNSMAHVIESTSGRPGIYNPHSASAGATERRRPSWAHLNEFPRKPTVSQLVKMGVSMGIHTQNLPVTVFDSSETDAGGGTDNDSSSSDDDFNDTESVASEGDVEVEPSKTPLLAALRRRRSYGDGLARPKSPRRERKPKSTNADAIPSYGATGSGQRRQSTRNNGRPVRLDPGVGKLERPTISRQGSSMRFSSMLVPETTIADEDGKGPRIMFAEAEPRPMLSRPSSVTQFQGRSTPDTRLSGDEGKIHKAVSFAEPAQDARTPTTSRNPARRKSNGGGDAVVDISEMLSSYKLTEHADDDSGSSYSNHALPLSFNDLPSRAQHLILNELMRQNSSDTAVLFTTLPIPAEGTCKDEEASLTYLSDVEILCNELPPVLLVLSNNMTVTVSL